MNQIEKYFERTGATPSSIAKQLEKPTSTITRAIRGERPASPSLAIAIERITDGDVTADQFTVDCARARLKFCRQAQVLA